ncbi:MAG: hypothetical protein HWN65_23910 [Candidatus Helarchaeota archaeon]|nr:hypothetical protein [Candidatus Helarchaeota archaeon]
MGTRYPLWNGWYGFAEPINKFAGWITIAFSIIWWLLFIDVHPKHGIRTGLLMDNLLRFIFGVLAGIFYLLVLQKAIAERDLSFNTHLWLWICFVLSWFPGWSGVFIWIQFAMVGVLSDIPFWVAFRSEN